MVKLTDDTDDDIAFFKAAMQGVKPLQKQAKVPLVPVTIQPNEDSKTKQAELKRRAVIRAREGSRAAISLGQSDLSDPCELSIAAEESVVFSRSALHYKTLRNLKRGDVNPEASIDLHGKGSARSQPILKNHVVAWLKQCSQVSALHSAQAKDGGAGALYVLLRR